MHPQFFNPASIPNARSEKLLRYLRNPAFFVKKRNKVYNGYKNHVVVNSETKIIEDYKITLASTHDSTVAPEMLEKLQEGSEVYGDSAYISEAIKKVGARKKLNMKINKRNYRNKEITEEEKEYNKTVSKVRARVSIKSFGGKVFRYRDRESRI